MYLSDRIRRMFLSEACPQNLSPKTPLSLKDLRFLQKKRVEKNLTKTVIKQQKVLYEKHIVKQLRGSANFKPLNTKNSFAKGPNKTSQCFPCQTLKKAKVTVKIPLVGFAPMILKNYDSGTFIGNKGLTLFVKSLKVQEKDLLLSFSSKQFSPPFSIKNQTLNGEQSDLLGNKRSYPSDAFSPLNRKNLFNCRYLYNRESLKTCIVPQIYKNQKPGSQAKILLHERKKIALLYGQLTKKDIGQLSRKAAAIPGFYEDNMFTLLESRIDVCIFRAGFSKTIASARQLIRNGSVLVNKKKIFSCKSRAKPGDLFTFTFKQEIVNPYKYTTLKLYNLYLSSNFLAVSKLRAFRETSLFPMQSVGKREVSLNISKKKENALFPELTIFQREKHTFKENSRFYFSKASTLTFYHYLYWGFFVYKLHEKEPIFLQNIKKMYLSLNKQSFHDWASFVGSGRQNNKSTFIVFFNVYTQLLLKKLCARIIKTKPFSLNPLFRKSVSSNNLWAIWGQKPLHLEISHKTGAFIYMYKPQKIISPVCFDWKL